MLLSCIMLLKTSKAQSNVKIFVCHHKLLFSWYFDGISAVWMKFVKNSLKNVFQKSAQKSLDNQNYPIYPQTHEISSNQISDRFVGLCVYLQTIHNNFSSFSIQSFLYFIFSIFAIFLSVEEKVLNMMILFCVPRFYFS